MTERLPLPDATTFPPLEPAHVRTLPAGNLMGRIHATSGADPSRWEELRRFGPTGSRFDHQPPPPTLHREWAVLYAAPALDRRVPVLRTCVAECFTERGAVELSRDHPYFALWRTTRPLVLLDVVDSDWVTLAGGNAAISSGLRETCRAWAREIYAHYTDPIAVSAGEPARLLDGIFYGCSTVPPARSVVLWERAEDAMPSRPAAHVALADAALRAELEAYAVALHLDLAP